MSRKMGNRTVTIAICILIYACSCSDDLPSEPSVSFTGILRMDEMNNSLGGDETDWLPRPESKDLSVIKSGVFPAYPNPMKGSTTLGFALADKDSVWIQAYDRPSAAPVETIWVSEKILDPGVYSITWTTDLAPGIYRVRINSKHGLSFYGDVQVEEW